MIALHVGPCNYSKGSKRHVGPLVKNAGVNQKYVLRNYWEGHAWVCFDWLHAGQLVFSSIEKNHFSNIPETKANKFL